MTLLKHISLVLFDQVAEITLQNKKIQRDTVIALRETLVTTQTLKIS
jgi:hypothetical protein